MSLRYKVYTIIKISRQYHYYNTYKDLLKEQILATNALYYRLYISTNE